MAGPKLSGTSAIDVFACANAEPFFSAVDGDEGVTYGGTCGP
jgi:hypothetical protein